MSDYDYEIEALQWIEKSLEVQMSRPDLSLIYATVANTYAVLFRKGVDDV